MPFCSQCGTQYADGTRFCPNCGAPTAAQSNPGQPNYNYNPYNNAAPASDTSNDKLMGILAYLGILVLIPIFAAPNSRFARYHANQGLVLCLSEIAYGIAMAIISAIFMLINFWIGTIITAILYLAYLVFLALVIIGIINAAKGQMKPLPIIGSITLLK